MLDTRGPLETDECVMCGGKAIMHIEDCDLCADCAENLYQVGKKVNDLIAEAKGLAKPNSGDKRRNKLKKIMLSTDEIGLYISVKPSDLQKIVMLNRED